MAAFDVNHIVGELHVVRQGWRESQKRSREPGGREFPSRDALAGVVEALKGALFPMRLGPPTCARRARIFMSAIRWTRRCTGCSRRCGWS